MTARLARVILYVQDVDRLASFYCEAFHLGIAEAIAGEWAVLRAGGCELALHRVGVAYRRKPGVGESKSNVKLVFAIDGPLADMREKLLQRGVAMGEIKAYAGTGPLCDGRDPEGNVFQLASAMVAGVEQ